MGKMVLLGVMGRDYAGGPRVERMLTGWTQAESKQGAKAVDTNCGVGLSAGTSTLVDRSSVSQSQEAQAIPFEMLARPLSVAFAVQV